jgi:hypothetical protein
MNVEALREQFWCDPQTGAVYLKRGTQRKKAGSRADFVRDSGYAFVAVDRKFVRAHRVVWALVNGQAPDCDIDHVNGVRSDNRIVNLRLASRSENISNARNAAVGVSGYRGVVWKQKAAKWAAQIKKDGKRFHLGLFEDPRAAHQAYVAASIELHGEFSVYATAA